MDATGQHKLNENDPDFLHPVWWVCALLAWDDGVLSVEVWVVFTSWLAGCVGLGTACAACGFYYRNYG